MMTYPIDHRPADPPALRPRVVIGAFIAGVALLLGFGIATDTISFAADGITTGRETVRDGGSSTADRIAELDAAYDGVEVDR